MISVADAYQQLFALVEPIGIETINIKDATNCVLREAIYAKRDQPPFAASAMDGYAIQLSDAKAGAVLKVIGQSTAGQRYGGTVQSGQAVRIFTGGVVPNGADKILIQEDCTRDADKITLNNQIEPASFIRPQGGDFPKGFKIEAPCRLTPPLIALAAAMNQSKLHVSKRPTIALIPTGDELVLPGETPNEDQIISSNNFGLKAMIESLGAMVRMMPIARDNAAALGKILELSKDADLIVTLGGASVGDYDLVHSTAIKNGLDTEFYKVAMRPGKPLMAGKLDGTPMIGLPGNPVSAMVCGTVFLKPMIEAMLGLPKSAPKRFQAKLTHDLNANGPREHYMRGRFNNGEITIFDHQDSSLLSVLANANCLAIRPVNDPARTSGDTIDYIET